MRISGLDHVQIAAPKGCETKARWFFGDLLGLAEIEKPESLRKRGGVWFAVGAQQLHLGVEEPFSPAQKAHPALRLTIDDLESLAARLINAGVDVRWDGDVPGIKRFYSPDPWGNQLEFVADE